MTEKITNELIYEVLKQLQGDMTAVKATLADHTRQFIRRRETLQAQMDVRLDRIENRLELRDAE